jgi:hypothetical protein
MPNIRLLNIVFFTAVASSLVHYTDNYLAFDRFPNDGVGPSIEAHTVWIAWIVFTVFGVAGYLVYRRGEIRLGSALLAVYSISGLIGIGHYTASGMSELAWWRHVHIWTDILCGIAVLTFAIWSVRQTREAATPAAP